MWPLWDHQAIWKDPWVGFDELVNPGPLTYGFWAKNRFHILHDWNEGTKQKETNIYDIWEGYETCNSMAASMLQLWILAGEVYILSKWAHTIVELNSCDKDQMSFRTEAFLIWSFVVRKKNQLPLSLYRVRENGQGAQVANTETCIKVLRVFQAPVSASSSDAMWIRNKTHAVPNLSQIRTSQQQKQNERPS